jgi:spermidine/putrescine transport system permease protein
MLRKVATAWAMLVFAFLYVPIFIVVLFAFNGTKTIAAFHGWSLEWFRLAIADPIYRYALASSVRIALAVAIVATVLGSMAALALARTHGKWRLLVDAVAYLTIVLPEIVLAVSTLIFLTQARTAIPMLPEPGTIPVFLGHLVPCSSLVMLIVRARYVGMGPSLEEAGRDLGASAFGTLFQVTLRLLSPAILASFLLAFTYSFDNYVLSAFLAGGSTQTWPMVVFAQVRFGVTPEINAMASILLAVTVTVLGLALLIVRHYRKIGSYRVDAVAGG